jgi:hypothetical protein
MQYIVLFPQFRFHPQREMLAQMVKHWICEAGGVLHIQPLAQKCLDVGDKFTCRFTSVPDFTDPLCYLYQSNTKTILS